MFFNCYFICTVLHHALESDHPKYWQGCGIVRTPDTPHSSWAENQRHHLRNNIVLYCKLKMHLSQGPMGRRVTSNYGLWANLACHLFLYSLQTKKGFYVFSWLKQTRGVFHGMWKLFKIHLSALKRKIVWGHNHAHSCKHCRWLLS